MSETQFKTKVLNHLKKIEHGFFFKISDKFLAGIPDILGCYKGRFIAIELKVGKNKPTMIQKYVMNLINNAGGNAFWINEETFKDLDCLLNLKNAFYP